MKSCENFITDLSKKKENEVNKLDFQKTKYLFDVVLRYIIENKYMVYGGFAINELIKKKFYNDVISDIDLYCKNPKKDSKNLAIFLASKGFKYIETKRSPSNPNTFKVFVEFTNICDFTLFDNKSFTMLEKIANVENTRSSMFVLPPVSWLKMLLAFELASPDTSGYRWEKLFDRFICFQKEYPTKKFITKFKKNVLIDESMLIWQFIKDNKLPVIGFKALLIHDNKFNHIDIISEDASLFEILSDNPQETAYNIKQLSKNFNIQINKHNLFKSVYSIYVKNNDKIIFLIDIHDVSESCYSITNIKGTSVGTLFTIYAYSLLSLIKNFFKDNDDINFLIYKIFKKIQNPENKKCSDKLISLNCYGNSISKRSILKKGWEEKKQAFRPNGVIVSEQFSIFNHK
jgi:hypothetical protein